MFSQKPSIGGRKSQIIKAAIAEKCRRSFYFFVKTMWSSIINEDPVWNWHIKAICDILQEEGERVKARKSKKYDYIIINIPPGSSKSTIVSEMYPLWCWIIDPSQRFICGSHNRDVSEDIADKCKKIFTSDLYIELFPEVGIRSDAKTHLENRHNGERYSTSTGSGITGIHAHQLIVDDPLDPKKAASQAELAEANKWMAETLSTRVVDKRLVTTTLVMQRLHEDDPTGRLLSNEKLRIRHICLPGIIQRKEQVSPVEFAENYADGLLDPIRMPMEAIENAKIVLGGYGFSGQILQNPVDLSKSIIKREWFEIIDEIPLGAPLFAIDTAYTDDLKNDPTGILTFKKVKNEIIIIDWITKYMEFPVLINFLKGHILKMGYTRQSMLYVEPKASGKSVVQQIKYSTLINVKESKSPDKDKVTRATALTKIYETGRVKLLKGNWNDDFLFQLSKFPVAKHDEAVDCLGIATEQTLVARRQKLVRA